ncbi:MAG: YnbE family lipoprotein [Oceanospirillaceae bacterium]|nr:YnbE family lipoprotein [Oceanospirillaceae bacterium]
MPEIFSNKSKKASTYCALLVGTILLGACAPKIAIEVPKEPITINLNIKIEHEILIKVDQQIDDLFSEQSDLF